jgi:hypothetical protein
VLWSVIERYSQAIVIIFVDEMKVYTTFCQTLAPASPLLKATWAAPQRSAPQPLPPLPYPAAAGGGCRKSGRPSRTAAAGPPSAAEAAFERGSGTEKLCRRGRQRWREAPNLASRWVDPAITWPNLRRATLQRPARCGLPRQTEWSSGTACWLPCTWARPLAVYSLGYAPHRRAACGL